LKDKKKSRTPFENVFLVALNFRLQTTMPCYTESISVSKTANHLMRLSALFLILWIIHKFGLIDAELGASKLVSNTRYIVHTPYGVSLYFISPMMFCTSPGLGQLSNTKIYGAIFLVGTAGATASNKLFLKCVFFSMGVLATIVPLYATNALDYSIGVRKNLGPANPYGDHFPQGFSVFILIPESPSDRCLLAIILVFVTYTTCSNFLPLNQVSQRKTRMMSLILWTIFFIFLLSSELHDRVGLKSTTRNSLDQIRKWSKILDSSESHLCIAPSLRPHQIHLVVATGDSKNSMEEVQWLKELGMSNASAFIYRRITAGQGNISGVLKGKSVVQWPCELFLEERLLAPNKGQEAAVYLAHIVEFYDNLPDAILFTHGHGPTSWHTDSANFIRRARAYYRGVVGKRTEKSKVEEDSELLLRNVKNTRTTDFQSQEYYRELTRHVAEDHALHHLEQFSKYHVSFSTCGKQRLCSGVCKDTDQNGTLHSRRLLDWTEVSPYTNPPQETEHPTYAAFQEIYDRLGNRTHPSRNNHMWSCCATFAVRPWHIRRHPKQLYEELLRALLDRDLPSFFSSRWFEFNWYRLLSGSELPDDYCRLIEGVDRGLPH
jgi:hypothetical protein